MNIEDFRNYCLSFDGVHDKMPFGKAASEYDRNILVFYVADKWFCFVNIDVFDFCCIKSDTAQIEDLQSRYEGIKPGYHMNKKYWISVCFNADVPDKEIKALVKQSYDIVVTSLSKKEKEALRIMLVELRPSLSVSGNGRPVFECFLECCRLRYMSGIRRLASCIS